MSKNVHIERGEAGSSGAKATPPKPAASAAAPRQLPLANVPRPALIGGGVALLVIILAGLWFMFGVGPEDSASFAASAGKEAPASPAKTAVSTDAGTGGNTSAAPSTSPTPADNAPTASSANGSTGMPVASSSAPADGGSAAGAPAAAGTTPVEVEGSPPANSHAGDGSTWKAGDAAGKVYRHGPASDP